MARRKRGHETFFQCSDRQRNTKNICKKFHEKVLSGFQKLRNIHQSGSQNTPKWSSTEMKMM